MTSGLLVVAKDDFLTTYCQSSLRIGKLKEIIYVLH